jgi:predicted amidophosphoribosyltransferase
MKQLLNSLAHLFFPHICAGCGYDLPGTSNLICFRCMNKIPYTSFHLQSNNPVEKIFWGRVYIRHSMSLCYFTRQSLVQRLLHQLKYNGNKELGIYMGKLMGMALAESGRFADIDVLLPLPMHPEKEKRRGYNQARVLCEGIAGILQIPIAADLLVKQQSTATQTKKGKMAERSKRIPAQRYRPAGKQTYTAGRRCTYHRSHLRSRGPGFEGSKGT